eukprot:6889565-Lingulodinium_polyedra.AAC.1
MRETCWIVRVASRGGRPPGSPPRIQRAFGAALASHSHVGSRPPVAFPAVLRTQSQLAFLQR